jgi:hypothetical protein
MNVGVTVALISAAVAVCSAAVSAYATARSIRLQHALTLRRAQMDRQAAMEDLVRRYREPLLLAAFDLQARICNIVQDGFFARHLASADPQEQQYARVSTLYRVGDFFGWTEILRRDLQFLDLGDNQRTRELAGCLAEVSLVFSDTTQRHRDGAFHLFRDEQRAIGELMLEPMAGDLRRHQCIGFATFTARLEEDDAFARWFQRLSGETAALADPAPGQLDRLVSIQHALIEVIRFLDPTACASPEHVSRDCPYRQTQQRHLNHRNRDKPVRICELHQVRT